MQQSIHNNILDNPIQCCEDIVLKGIFVNSLTKDSIRLCRLDGKNQVNILAGIAQVLDELPETV